MQLMRDLSAGQNGFGAQLNRVVESLPPTRPSSAPAPPYEHNNTSTLSADFMNQLYALGSDRINAETAVQLQMIYAALAFQDRSRGS